MEMGKYTKKRKVTGAVREVPQKQSSLGVRTRARSLAIQRLQLSSAPPREVSSTSYLQLRSGRLRKPPVPEPKAPSCGEEPSPGSDPGSRSSHGGAGALPVYSKREEAANSKGSPENDAAVEVSFGENVLEVEGRSRNSRETTPCSLIRDSGTIGTPGSTTRPTNSTDNKRTRSSAHKNIPTAREMEEYFSGPEQLQQKKFVEKYNFDPVKNMPLPGRYEWVKLDD